MPQTFMKTETQKNKQKKSTNLGTSVSKHKKLFILN